MLIACVDSWLFRWELAISLSAHFKDSVFYTLVPYCHHLLYSLCHSKSTTITSLNCFPLPLHVNVTVLDMWDHSCWLALSRSCVSNLGQSWPRSWLYHMWPWSTDHISIMYLQCNKIYRTQASKLAATSRLSASWVPVINLDMIATTCPHACVPLALGLG